MFTSTDPLTDTDTVPSVSSSAAAPGSENSVPCSTAISASPANVMVGAVVSTGAGGGVTTGVGVDPPPPPPQAASINVKTNATKRFEACDEPVGQTLDKIE